jgi:NAD(P)-dependent dehydrogenase (short-subunit alcohol dehydrogenase family)
VSLQGQCAVVIGGSRGLGEAIVKRLADAGASVVFTGRRLETLQPIAETVTAAGGMAVPVASDVSKVEESQRVIDLAVDRFGRVDILVSNAAVFEARVALETTEEIWDRTHEIDLKGAFFAAQAAATAMIAGPGVDGSTSCRPTRSGRWGCWSPTTPPRPDWTRPPGRWPKSLPRTTSW